MFRKALVKMFKSKNLDCVFSETFVNEKDYEHMVIECIPIDFEMNSMAPMYFKVQNHLKIEIYRLFERIFIFRKLY